MTLLREHWEGVSLSGDYTLEEWLGGDGHAAFFRTSLAADGRRAVVKLVLDRGAENAVLLDLWHRTRQLRHSNLIELLEYGSATHGGENVVYAVFENPDDTLASALSESPLNEQESREILFALIDALRYLHAQGLVLGELDPTHIVAVGDRIKLSTGTLRDAGASSAYREDVRLLGLFWQQHLMAASPKSAEIAGHAADADPQTRWTLAEIGDALKMSIPAVAPPAPPPPVQELIATPPPAEPAIPVTPDIVPDEEPIDVAPSRGRPPMWIFGGAAAAALLVVAAAHRPRPATVETQPPIASVSVPRNTVLPAPLPNAAVSKPSPTGGKAMWRVIAFTYRSREAAVKKVQQINQRDPSLRASVFTPKDKGGYYLVALGGRVTHDEAVRLQRSARSKGLPRDLYVQNYSE